MSVCAIAVFPRRLSARPSKKTSIMDIASMCLAVFPCVLCVCVCMCLKPDNPEAVPSSKFTSVLTELTGIPTQSGGDRQCISSLSY